MIIQYIDMFTWIAVLTLSLIILLTFKLYKLDRNEENYENEQQVYKPNHIPTLTELVSKHAPLVVKFGLLLASIYCFSIILDNTILNGKIKDTIKDFMLPIIVLWVAILVMYIAILFLTVIYDSGRFLEFYANFKIRKRYISLVIAVITAFLCYNSSLMVFDYKFEHRGKDLAKVIYSALGVPQENSITTIANTVHLSKAEWDKPSCKESEDSEKLLPLKDCIKISGANSIVAPYCNLWSRKNCISLVVNETIFDHPILSTKFIDIIERPCDYIGGNKDIRKSLGCDEKWNENGKVIVYFYNNNEKSPRYHIVTNRKDKP